MEKSFISLFIKSNINLRNIIFIIVEEIYIINIFIEHFWKILEIKTKDW